MAVAVGQRRQRLGERVATTFKVKREKPGGDPLQVSPRVRALILELRAQGLGYERIVKELHRRRVKPLGKAWHVNTVRRIIGAEAKLAS